MLKRVSVLNFVLVICRQEPMVLTLEDPDSLVNQTDRKDLALKDLVGRDSLDASLI